MSKPIIGIVAKHYKKDNKRLETFIRDELKQAIFDNEAIAIAILPPNEGKINASNSWHDNLTTTEKHNFYDAISMCDGIVLQGGGFSDEYECFIAKYCYDYDIPILGICAGNLNLVRALGGKVCLIDNVNHNSDNEYVHSIKIDKDSKIYQIIKKQEITVNSRHTKSVIDSPILKSVAFSPDGVVEAIEAVDKKFFLGVQFHPESLYKKDESMNNIFRSFIESCK